MILKMLKDSHVFYVKWKIPSTSAMYPPLWSLLNIMISYTSMHMFHVNNSSRLNELFFSFIRFYSKKRTLRLSMLLPGWDLLLKDYRTNIHSVYIGINRCKIGDWMKKFYFHFPLLFNNRSSIGLVCIMLKRIRLRDYM